MVTALTVGSTSTPLLEAIGPKSEPRRTDSTDSDTGSSTCSSSLDGRAFSDNKSDDELVFIPANGIKEDTVKQQMEIHLSDRSQPSGVRTHLNGRGVAIFYWKEKLYCMDEKCPHLGGPLYLGDIEDAVTQGGNPCIVCPWHKWCYDLSTGRITRPDGRRTEQLHLHQVKRGEAGEIRVGFESLHQSFFVLDDV